MNHERLAADSHDRTQSHLVEKACGHWEAQRKAAAARRDPSQLAPHSFTIALAREAGTDGSSVAREVGNRLGWCVYDHELLERVARDLGLRTILLESVDERRQSWLTEAFEVIMSSPGKSAWGPLVSENAYVHHLVKTVLALGLHGECVIVGRGAAFILPPATTVRARLVAPLKDRTEVLQGKLGISAPEAARQVRAIDRERSDFVEDHFFKDPSDPRNYDLVLNSARLSAGQSADLILETLHCLQARAAEKATGKVPL